MIITYPGNDADSIFTFLQHKEFKNINSAHIKLHEYYYTDPYTYGYWVNSVLCSKG